MSSPSATSPNDPPPRPPGFQFTIRQMMGMVIFAAVTCAGLLPAVRGAWHSLPAALLSETLILTGIWWLFIALFVRVGPLQFWLMRAVSFVPILLGFLAVTAFLAVIVVKIPKGNVDFAFYLVATVFVVALFLLAVYRWAKHLLPVFCPSCRRLTLISDTGTSRPVLRGSKATRWCWSCRKRYGRVVGGEWESVDFRDVPPTGSTDNAESPRVDSC